MTNGQFGLGEAVPLPGYNWETLETIRETVTDLVAASEGKSCSAIRERCHSVRADHPFAASAVMTALEMPQFLNGAKLGIGFPVSAPVAADWPLTRSASCRRGASQRWIRLHQSQGRT